MLYFGTSYDQSSSSCGWYLLWLVPTVLGSSTVTGALTNSSLLHFVCDLKTAQMNKQHSLIWELMLYKFRLSNDTVETTKTFAMWKSLSYQARSQRFKTVDSEAMLPAIEANLASSTQRESNKLSILQSSVNHHLHDLCKSIKNCWTVLQVIKILQTFHSAKNYC